MIALHLSDGVSFFSFIAVFFHSVICLFIFFNDICAIFGLLVEKMLTRWLLIIKIGEKKELQREGMDVGNCACILVQSISGVTVTDEKCVVFTA